MLGIGGRVSFAGPRRIGALLAALLMGLHVWTALAAAYGYEGFHGCGCEASRCLCPHDDRARCCRRAAHGDGWSRCSEQPDIRLLAVPAVIAAPPAVSIPGRCPETPSAPAASPSDPASEVTVPPPRPPGR